jgi:hypothetical protein
MRLENLLRPAVLALTATYAVYGQTLINLGTQGKNIDFSNAPSTRPEKTGTAPPATCSVGDLFFNTTAPLGQNLYGCGATNTWAALGGNGNSLLMDPGANGLVQRTAPSTTIAVAAPTGTVVGTTDTQTLTNKSIAASEINSGTLGAARMPSFSGDISTAAGSTAAALATVNSNVGTFGSSTVIPVITADAKGRITSITTANASGGGSGMNQLTGDVLAGPGTGSQAATLATVNSTVGTFGSSTVIPVITADAKGRITSITTATVSGGGSGITQLTGDVIAGPGSGSQPTTLATVNSSPGTCGDATHVCVITTNGKGLVTSQSLSAISGVPAGANAAVQYNNSGSLAGDASNFSYNATTHTASVTNLTVTGTCTGCAASGLSNPMTASGDMIVGGTSGTPTRLAAGANGYVLTISGGSPSWQAPTGGTGTANAINNGPLSGLPATCTVGAIYFATDQPSAQQLYTCSSANTWTQTMSVGASGALAVTNGSLDIVTSVVPRLNAANVFSGQMNVQNGLSLLTTNAQPACSASVRGLFWYQNNGTSQDHVQVCVYSGSAYSWVNLY